MRIVVADHHTQVLQALNTLLLENPDFHLVGGTTDADSLLRLVKHDNADVILVDMELPGDSLDHLTAELHRLRPRPYVVAMGSQYEFGRMALRAGADAYVSKGDGPDWLLNSLLRFARRVERESGRNESAC